MVQSQCFGFCAQASICKRKFYFDKPLFNQCGSSAPVFEGGENYNLSVFVCFPLQRCEKLTLLLYCHLLSAPFHEPVSPLVSPRDLH